MSIIEHQAIYGMHELKNAAPPGMAVKGYALPAFENISETARPYYYSPISPNKSSKAAQQVWFVFRPARHIPSRPVRTKNFFPNSHAIPGLGKIKTGTVLQLTQNQLNTFLALR